MCGRTRLVVPFATLAKLYRLEQVDLPIFPVVGWQNIAPTQPIPILRRMERGQLRLDLVRWGLIPHWAKDRSVSSKMFNARIETIATKPAFRTPLVKRRCVVLADTFYEWRAEGKRKVPYAVRMPDGAPFAMAGLWESWTSPEGDVIESCTVVTCESQGNLAQLHHRMPVVLDPLAVDPWLDPADRDAVHLVALLYQGARYDFTCERIDAVPSDGGPMNAPSVALQRQLKLFG